MESETRNPLAALAAAAAGSPSAPSAADELSKPKEVRPAMAPQTSAGQATASEAEETLNHACWVAQLRGDNSKCTPGFSGGTAHFKNKFCPACKAGTFEIPVTHIRALPGSWNTDAASLDLKLSLSNGHSVGFWKILPDGEGRFRFVNNTLDCEGPQLVVFRELPSPLLTWGELPERWVDNGKVILQVAKGTLVPAKTLRCGHFWLGEINSTARSGVGGVSLAVDVGTMAFPWRAPRPSGRSHTTTSQAHVSNPLPAPRQFSGLPS